MQTVFVVDTKKQPLDPIHPGKARLLLKQGKAAIWRRFPFTIILKYAVPGAIQEPLRVKLDPGSKTTGVVVLNDARGEVVFAMELSHRGHKITEALETRRAIRRSRRQRKTRYRQPRFDNRRNKGEGWLPPSLESRIRNVLTWIKRLSRVCLISACSLELVKFDMQQMDHPEISGVQYQQGTLAGYEVREYLLEKWGRQCAYCGARDVPLEVEHITPRSKSRDDRVCNLTLSCHSCNDKKGTQDIRDFLQQKPDLLQKILAQAKVPRKDAAAVNVTRWALLRRLQALDLMIECGSGGMTKYNRQIRDLPKAHWIDAACVGKSTPEVLTLLGRAPLLIKATGRGSRQFCSMDKYGFPRTSPKAREKSIKGFQTGDIVRADVPSGKKAGTHTGRVLVRATGSFDIQTKQGRVQGINARYCRPLHKSDGYNYQKGARYDHGQEGPRPIQPNKECLFPSPHECRGF